MKLFIRLDVSLAKTAVCVVSEHGRIVKEAETESEPEALAHCLHELGGSIAVISLWENRGGSLCHTVRVQNAV